MAILTREEFVTYITEMTKKVADEHGMTYDEVLLNFPTFYCLSLRLKKLYDKTA